MEDEKEKALTYFEKSLVQLNEFMNKKSPTKDTVEILKIYFTTAKFYSEIKEYRKAIDLCDLSISLQKKEHMNYELDRLYYEKAFNLFKLGNFKKAEKYFYHAASLAQMSGNKILSEVIKKNMIDFKMRDYPFY